jgi:hypothetical protein
MIVVENGEGLTVTCDPVLTTIDADQPESFALVQNYPNPFNPTTVIPFQIAEASMVRLTVYDVTGRLVKTLLLEELQPGSYTAEWDGRDMQNRSVSSGLYIYRLEAGSYSQTMRMTLLR